MDKNQLDRGNRTAPKRSSRIYCSLVVLLNRITHVVNSELLPAGEKLLDYGCGNKPYEDLLKTKFPMYVGADLPGNSYADVPINEDGTVGVEDGSFDCVLSSQVLEHVVSPQKYLTEARRVLKPGGALILSTHGIWPYHPDPTDFWRWTVSGLQAEVRKAGFEVLSIEGVMGLETAALQLWQDATYDRLPSFVRPLYASFFQTIINFIEKRRTARLCDDAMIFVLLARRANGVAPN